MSVVIELVGAIEADPQDPAPQLVLADHLLSAEDPRGELICMWPSTIRENRAGPEARLVRRFCKA